MKNPKTRRQARNRRPVKTSRIGRLKFLPAIAIALFATVLAYQPQMMQSPTRGVLAYATNVSASGLLNATNAQRSANGVATLNANALLNNAAQTKAEDMVTRDYWSHNTPDGQPPWVFITNAGYSYLSAGENLAYGFMTSSDTVNGWMNSPPHKANLLGTNYTEVGFGIANSPNYVGNGQQTVVVAMYARPQVAGAQTTAPPAAQPTTPTPTPKPTPKATPAPSAPIETPAEPTPEPVPTQAEEEIIVSAPLDSEAGAITTASSMPIERVKLLNGLSTAVIIAGVCAISVLWLIHKGFHLHRYLRASERFVAKHWHLDLTVLAIIYLGTVLLSTSGFVR